MKNNVKTVSILLNVAIMFATVFALITITYSWYNQNTGADISTISMTVSEFEGILLSGDGINWSPTLSADGGTSSISINQDAELASISTSATVIDGNMQFYTGEFSDNAFNTILLTESTFYYVFDIYVLNNNDFSKKLTLGKDSSVVSVNNKGVELSIRAAFLNLGYASNMLDAIVIDGTGISSVDYIWEANSTSRHEKLQLYQSDYVTEGKVDYEGVNMVATGLELSNNLVVDDLATPEQEAVNVYTYDPIGAGDDSDITLLTAGAITKLRTYIWCEGQDIDCVNSISGGTANLNFSFNSYDVELIGEQYVAVEKFIAPTIANASGVDYSWSATTTNVTIDNYSSDYIIKISRIIESQLITIRAIHSTQTTVNINDLQTLEPGDYSIEVKVYSRYYCGSDYSNTLSFSVLGTPQNFTLLYSTISWDTVTNAASYTISVYDESTQTTYTTTTTSLLLNLATAMFDGNIYLQAGKEYQVSVRANGNLGYVNSQYTTTLNWSY